MLAPQIAPMAVRLTAVHVFWLVVYLATMAAVAAGLFYVRQRTIAALDAPAAREAWEDFRRREAAGQNDAGSPVQRRAPTSAEPPALVLMRDAFPAILTTALTTGTFLFGFLVFVLRGMFRAGNPR